MGKIAVNDNKIMGALSEGVLIIDPHSGDVFRRITGKLKKMKLQTDYRGYKRFMLSHHGKTFTILVHRLVWMSVNGEPSSPLMQINHIDGDKGNNSLSNLEMVTGHRNQRHAVEIGLKKTGPKILTPEQIAEIQIRYQYRVKGGDCLDALAKQYSVSRSTIWRAIYSYDSTQRDRGKEHHDKVGRRRDMRLVAEWLTTSS
jgi:hypothetical protein